MKRRDFLSRASLLTAGTFMPFRELFGGTALANFTELRRNTGFFTGSGGTIGWLAASDALVVVDSQNPESGKECLTGLQNETDHPLDVLINTHHHFDHTGGNTVFRKPAKHIVSHKNVPGFMKQAYGDRDRELVFPDKTFSKTWKEDFGSETVHAKYYGPAHTNGDAVIYFEKANVVHVGDLVFNRLNPLTDPAAGASIHNWIKVLEMIAEDYPSDAIYIFGHANWENPEFEVTGTKADLAVMGNYLSGLIDYVQEGIDQGKSKKEIIEKKEMENFPQFMYANFFTLSQNLEIVYNEIMNKG